MNNERLEPHCCLCRVFVSNNYTDKIIKSTRSKRNKAFSVSSAVGVGYMFLLPLLSEQQVHDEKEPQLKAIKRGFYSFFFTRGKKEQMVSYLLHFGIKLLLLLWILLCKRGTLLARSVRLVWSIRWTSLTHDSSTSFCCLCLFLCAFCFCDAIQE